MKTVELIGNSGIRVIETADPVPANDEVVVRTAYSAICGSELGAYRGDGVAGGNSGHEAAGTVAEIGDAVTSLKVGDRVGLSAIVGCGECEACLAGRYTWCREFRFFGNMHAERIVIPAIGCHRIPDDLPWQVGVLLAGDGMGVAFHTSKRVELAHAETVAVFGLGPVGLSTVLLQSHLGREVIGIDLSAERLAYASELGAAHAIDAGAGDPVEAILGLTGGSGIDVAVEAAGRPETAKNCFAAVRTGGCVVFNGEQGPLPLSPSDDFIRRDITALGSWFYHFGEFPEMVELYRNGLEVGRLISHEFAVDDAAEAYRRFAAGKTAKVVIRYD